MSSWLDLSMSYDRKRPSDDIMDELRTKLTQIAGPVTVEFAKMNTGPPLGKPVEVKLKGKYIAQLRRAAGEAKADPLGLFSKGYTPRYKFSVFGTDFYLSSQREDENFRFFVAYVANPAPRRGPGPR